MDFPTLRGIQFGFDIATSATILGAAASWYFNQRKNRRLETDRRKLDLERGINDAARAVVTESIQEVLGDLALDFNRLVDVSQSVQRPIDGRLQGGGRPALVNALDQGKLDIESMEQKLDACRDKVSHFYEAATTSRYRLFPALHSLPEGDEAIGTLKDNLDTILEAHNRITGGYVALLAEVKQLLTLVVKTEFEAGEDALARSAGAFYQAHHGEVNSILYDPDYEEVVDTFVPSGSEPAFAEIVAKRRRGEDLNEAEQHLFGQVASNFLGTLLSDPNRVVATVLIGVSQATKQACLSCKTVLVNLAAVSCRVLSKDNGRTIPALAKELASEKYFALGAEIR